MLVRARTSLMNLSTENTIAIPGTSAGLTTLSVAASVMKPAPVTPLAPFDVSHRMRGIVDDVAQPVAALAERHQRKAEQDREQQYLHDVTARQRADHAVRNDVEEEIDRLLRLRLLDVACDRRRVRLGGQPVADLDQIAHQQPDH